MSSAGSILAGDSGLPLIEECFNIPERSGIKYNVIVSSAHSSPEQTVERVKSARGRGIGEITDAAGGAAHPPGVVASH